MDRIKQSKEDLRKIISKTAQETELLRKELLALKSSGIQDKLSSAPAITSVSSQLPGRIPKRQPEKRVELSRSRRALPAENRKEKLQQLDRQARLIVRKNVEAAARRARSRSREPPIVRSMTFDQEPRAIRSRSVSTGRRKAKQDESVILSYNCVGKTPVESRKEDPKRTISIRKENLLTVPEPVYGGNKEGSNLKLCLDEDECKPTQNEPRSNVNVPNVTSSVKPVPIWLQEKKESDPCNIINTVKRQLKYVYDKKYVDVGVQGNLDQPSSAPVSNLKSFISHRCMNLDPKTVDHIELHKNIDGRTHTKSSTCSEYGSDTSKNIPSISTESGSSLRRNAELLKNSYDVLDLRRMENAPPNLDAQKINDVRLNSEKEKKQAKAHLFSDNYSSDFVSELDKRGESVISCNGAGASISPNEKMLVRIEQVKKQLFSDDYSSDFVPELDKRRDSVISFNCATVSPNNVTKTTYSLSMRKPESKTDSELSSIKFRSLASTYHPSTVQSESHMLGVESKSAKDKQTLSESSSAEVVSEQLSRKKSDFKTTKRKNSHIGLEASSSIRSALEGLGVLPAGFTSELHPKKSKSEASKSKSFHSDSEASIGVASGHSPDGSTAGMMKSKTLCIDSEASSTGIATGHSTKDSVVEIVKSKSLCSGSASSLVPSKTSSQRSMIETLESKRSHTESFARPASEHPSKKSVIESIRSKCSDSDSEVSSHVSLKPSSKRPIVEISKSIGSELSSAGLISERPSKKTVVELHNNTQTAVSSPSEILSERIPSPKTFMEFHRSQSEQLLDRNEAKLPKNPSKSIRHMNVNYERNDKERNKSLMRNITIRSCDNTLDDVNENAIHLKFEAEIHLLTDFNRSIRRFSEIEKAFESLRGGHDHEKVTTRLQNKDTQTSRLETFSSSVELPLDLTQASDITCKTVDLDQTDDTTIYDLTSSVMHVEKERNGDENGVFRRVMGMSINMFDRLIKDEDARVENWKKVLKIREQALLDRTRGELLWLEMQKKQLIETGKLTEASLIKKKQRGILLKHQQERHEMQRMKRMQRQDSRDRKMLLRKERQQIKKQLLSDKVLSDLKPASHRNRSQERRFSGPFKVTQRTSETTIHSETSVSKSAGLSNTDQEIQSITTRTSKTHSVVNLVPGSSDHHTSDVESLELDFFKGPSIDDKTVSNVQKTLLMREQALAKRRKTVGELLQWHKNLLDEEKAIEDLEKKIVTIISKIPNDGNDKASLTSTPPVPSNSMSQLALELSPAKVIPNIIPPEELHHSEESNRVVSTYSTDFDVETAPAQSDEQSSVSSISQLIEDFTKIEDNIMNLALVSNNNNNNINLVNEEVTEPSNHVENDSSVIIIKDPSESAKNDVAESSKRDEENGTSTESANVSDSSVIIVEDAIVVPEIEENVIEENEQSPEIPEPTTPSKEDISTSRQYDDIEDLATSNLEQASTSREETVEELELAASASPPSIEEERPSFENKTDEEKAASLSNSRSTKPRLGEPTDEEASSSTSKLSADVKARVEEILDVISSPSGDLSSARSEDVSLLPSPEPGVPVEKNKPLLLGNEVEELHRKQLAIEQEIKLLKEQQKEVVRPFYIREIPNKPPPPYTPPSKTKAPKVASVIPATKEEVEQIAEYSSKIIYKAYLSNNLDKISISDNTLNLVAKNIDKGCCKYVFGLCKEIAKDHYGQFEVEAGPSWLRVDKKLSVKPLDVDGLKQLMLVNLFEMFGFEKTQHKREGKLKKWLKKKRDNVDQVLVHEIQTEETTWTEFDREELQVKDQVTKDIMEMLLKETVQVMKTAMEKKWKDQK